MKAFFDTSALVPVFYDDHLHHGASFERFVDFDKSTGYCGAHSLAEIYSTLTRMPGKHRASPEQAMFFLDSIQDRLTIVSLDVRDYVAALHESASLGIVGGAIYDALLARCAMKAESEVIYTWNVRHFSLCGPEVIGRLRTP